MTCKAFWVGEAISVKEKSSNSLVETSVDQFAPLRNLPEAFSLSWSVVTFRKHMLYLHTSLYVQGTRVIFYVSLSLLHWREWSGTFLIAVRCMRLRIGL